MKNAVILVLISCCLLPSAYSQVKVTKATSQKVTGGAGGTFMNYEVELFNRGTDSLVVDSIRTRAGFTDQRFYYNKTERALCNLSFGYALVKPEKCKVCPDVLPNQSNLTKGVIIYYHTGKKKGRLKLKKFTVLDDKIQP